MKHYKAKGNQVVVKPEPKEKTTEAGLIVRRTVDQHCKYGEVTSVGPEVQDDLVPGDIVAYIPQNTTVVGDADGEVEFITENNILFKHVA